MATLLPPGIFSGWRFRPGVVFFLIYLAATEAPSDLLWNCYVKSVPVPVLGAALVLVPLCGALLAFWWIQANRARSARCLTVFVSANRLARRQFVAAFCSH